MHKLRFVYRMKFEILIHFIHTDISDDIKI